MAYVISIKSALLIFPFIAFLLTFPFLLIQYHKYGAISFFKAILLYSFVFYLICAYFLVIMPLPKISEVAKLTSPRTQLIPFCFLFEFLDHSSFDLFQVSTYFSAMKESYFYVPLFNVFLTIPFGMYLRYYLKCDFKKTVFCSFCLSLFFELTQLSGLYFIYPRGYRLFDIDDLILNTFGGMVGYVLCKPLLFLLPDLYDINLATLEKGKVITGFRRTFSKFVDFLLCLVLFTILRSVLSFRFSFFLLFFVYFFIVPIFLHTSTFGERFLKIQVLDNSGKPNMLRLFYRKFLALFVYIFIPLGFSYMIIRICDPSIREFVALIVLGVLLFVYFVIFIQYLFTSKKMFYERLSKTEKVSMIK